MARATWRAFGVSSGIAPTAASSSFASTIRFEAPDALDLHLKAVTGSTGREFAGVPVSSMSPGSSVTSRDRSASMYANEKRSSPVVPVLNDLAVHVGPQPQIRRIHVGRIDELRADRAEAVLAL